LRDPGETRGLRHEIIPLRYSYRPSGSDPIVCNCTLAVTEICGPSELSSMREQIWI